MNARFVDADTVTGNQFSTGTVSLSDNDQGGSLFTLTNVRPADAPAARCIQVTYDGDGSAEIRLYGSVTGTGLATYLNLTIERGTGGTYPTCGGFTPDSATYAAPDGVIYSGTLAGFTATHASYATGLPDPVAGAPATWTTGTTRAYRLTLSVQNDPAAESLTADPTFLWGAENI